MIEKGSYNIYDNDGNTKYVQTIRDNIKGFHELVGDKVYWLAYDIDTSKDVTFGEDVFPNIVAVYENVRVRTSDGKSLGLQKEVTSFGYILSNSRTILLNMDHFHDLTFEKNKSIPELSNRSWIPQVGDIIYSDIYKQAYKVSDVKDSETTQTISDKTVFSITITPHTIKNLRSDSLELNDIEGLPNGEALSKAISAIFGTTQVSNVTEQEEEIDKIKNTQDVKQELYSLNENGDIVTTSRDSLLGEF